MSGFRSTQLRLLNKITKSKTISIFNLIKTQHTDNIKIKVILYRELNFGNKKGTRRCQRQNAETL
ncbi:hypothetical protein ATN83_4978 [Raoultella ornithinolytica]|nr:hypothetical protein ATN83_4978 [Raoultella ornithinolytica]